MDTILQLVGIIQQLKENSPIAVYAVHHCLCIACSCGSYATSLDEIHCWCDPGHADGLFNHPSPATKPFPSGKDRQQLEPFPRCVAWVTLWYVLALALYIEMFDPKIRYLSISPCNHVHIIGLSVRFRLWWTALKCLSSLFLSCSTGTRLLQQSSPGSVVLPRRWLQVLVFTAFFLLFFFLHLMVLCL